MSRLTYGRGLCWGALASALVVAAAACSSSGSGTASSGASSGPTVSASASGSSTLDLSHPTKALCKKPSYKIGYDVFSDSQPFAVSLSDGKARWILDLAGDPAVTHLEALLRPQSPMKARTSNAL